MTCLLVCLYREHPIGDKSFQCYIRQQSESSTYSIWPRPWPQCPSLCNEYHGDACTSQEQQVVIDGKKSRNEREMKLKRISCKAIPFLYVVQTQSTAFHRTVCTLIVTPAPLTIKLCLVANFHWGTLFLGLENFLVTRLQDKTAGLRALCFSLLSALVHAC